MTTRKTNDPDALNSEAGLSGDIINIPDNVLQAATAGYDQEDQDDLQWLLSYGDRELGGSRARLCDAIGTDWTTVFRICTGRYAASIDNFMAKVRALKKAVLEGGSSTFVETPVTKKIFATLDYALTGDADGGKMVMISGPARRSKTAAVKEWCRQNNHGKSVYIDIPTEGGIRGLVMELAGACRIGKGRKTNELRDRVLASFNRRRILVVDEVARLFMSKSRARLLELDFIRRLHDVQKCAVAFIVTPVVKEIIDSGELRAFLEQLVGRISEPLVIPEKVFRSESVAICSHFAGGKPSDDLVDFAHRIANEPGKLGVLFDLMRQANVLANRKREPLAYSHLAAAYARKKQRTTWTEA